MKKIILIILSIIILTGPLGSNFTYAENTYDKKLEKAIVKVKEILNISDEYNNFDSKINSYDEGINFSMNWSSNNKNLAEINIITDIDGNIIYLNKYLDRNEDLKPREQKITKEEGMEKALEFISKMDKSLLKEVKALENEKPMNPKDREYNYEFTRYINNIKFPENNLNITIDKYSGEVTNFYSNWDRKLVFPATDKIISLEEAKIAYESKIGLKPIYKSLNERPRTSDTDNKYSHYLAYSVLKPRRVIDAITGEPIDIGGYNLYGENRDEEAEQKVMESSGLSLEEEIAKNKLIGILDISDIEKKARELLKINKEYEMENSYLNSDYKNDGDYIWSLYFMKNIDNKEYGINISLNAKTGDLVSFYKSKPYNESDKSKLKKAEALEIAKSFIKEVNPDKQNEIEYIENEYLKDGSLNYNFEFIRKIEGIYVEQDMIDLVVDGVSGDINSYNLSWYKGQLPSSENVISRDKAHEILWSEIGYELIYVSDFNKENPREKNKTVRLVYSIKPSKPLIISGITGEILNYNGKAYSESKISNYKDIENSYAKDKIKILAEYGISFDSNEFKPKEKIKQKDFLYLLWKSINPYRTEDASLDRIYDEFIRNGYILEEDKNPDRVITKEEATKLIIKAMKLEKIAEIDGIYKDIFKDEKDISKELKGYMNLAYGLKIISGDGSGNIKPKQELKREDGANMIYNYLFN